MSSDGTYQTRASRRADRDRPPASRASAGTAAAILVLAALIGFGGGAIAGAMGGGSEAPAAENGEAGTDVGASPGATADSSTEDDATDEEPAEAVPGEGVTLTSAQDGTEVPSGEEGRIYVEGRTNPPVVDVVLTIERSLDGGQTWGDAGSSRLTTTTRDDGTFESSFWSGRNGENRYRVVGEAPDGQRLESDPIIVTVVGD